MVTLQECDFNIMYWRIFQSNFESSGLTSELVQQCFKFKHENFCVRLDKKNKSKINFLVESGLQNSIEPIKVMRVLMNHLISELNN